MKARLLSLVCHPTQYWNGADETLIKIYGNSYDEYAQPMRLNTPWQLQIEVEFGMQAVIEVWDRQRDQHAHAKELRGVHYIDRFRVLPGVNQATFTSAGASYVLHYEVAA